MGAAYHPDGIAMTHRQRLRRVAILCFACTRNLAYYRAGWNQGVPVFNKNSNIERTVNSNFLDLAVLEWCKLFLPKEKHAWPTIVIDHRKFETGLLAQLDMERDDFDSSTKELRTYRNKFIAHLDSLELMQFPLMDTVKNSVFYYFDYILQFKNDGATFEDVPHDLTAYYQRCEEEGREFCGR